MFAELAYYMSLPYRVVVYPEPSGVGFTAAIPDLPGCLTSADTWRELESMIHEAKVLWLHTALEDGDSIPMPQSMES